jgi:hypothetical protein
MYQQTLSCPVHDNVVVIEAEIFMKFLQLVIDFVIMFVCSGRSLRESGSWGVVGGYGSE